MLLRLVLAGLLSLMLPVAAHAAFLTGSCDSDDPGLCEKTLSSTDTTLSITLTNTSSSGFITADAFNIPTNGEIFTLTPSPTSNFTFATGTINTAPFGTRNAVLSTDPGDFEGGGEPDLGIGAGESVTFNFTVTGGFSDEEATALFNSEVIRLRGFEGGGSDKDLILTNGNGSVPEPGTLLLFGLGLAGLALAARKTSHNRT